MISDYHEIDASPMATQQQKWMEETEEKNNWRAQYEKFCEENPWDLECKMFDL